MKLTKLTLENYRSFKGKHEIEFAPITLLFGANSAGKSSVIKAIKGFETLSIDDAFNGESKVSVKLSFARDSKNMNPHELFSAYSEIYDYAKSKNKLDYFFEGAKHFKHVLSNFCIERIMRADKIKYSDKYLLENPEEKNTHFVFYSETINIYINDEIVLSNKGGNFKNNKNYTRDYASIKDVDYIFLNTNHPIFDKFKFEKELNVLKDHFNKGHEANHELYLRSSCIFGNYANDLEPMVELFIDYSEVDSENYNAGFVALGLFSGIKKLYRTAIFESKFLEHLGPLRKILSADFQFSGNAKISVIPFSNDKELPDNTSYVGERAWKNLSSSKVYNDIGMVFHQNKLLKNVNNWLTHWFHTPYEIDFQSVYTLAIDTPEKQLALNEGKIGKEHFDALSYELRIKNLFNGSITPADKIGVGISQLTPVIVNAIETQNFSVEQPELHIHPRMQTVVGDLFIFEGLFEDAEAGDEGAVSVTVKNLNGEDVTYYFKEKAQENKSFILCETHSEHLLLRLLKRVRQGILNPNDLAITYVESNRGESKVTRIGVDEEGDFTNQWPDGFFEERLEELF